MRLICHFCPPATMSRHVCLQENVNDHNWEEADVERDYSSSSKKSSSWGKFFFFFRSETTEQKGSHIVLSQFKKVFGRVTSQRRDPLTQLCAQNHFKVQLKLIRVFFNTKSPLCVRTLSLYSILSSRHCRRTTQRGSFLTKYMWHHTVDTCRRQLNPHICFSWT